MVLSNKFMILNFETFDSMSKNGDDDELSNLEFPKAFSHAFSIESFWCSPEGHEDEADWKLEEGDDLEVVRESELLSGYVLEVGW